MSRIKMVNISSKSLDLILELLQCNKSELSRIAGVHASGVGFWYKSGRLPVIRLELISVQVEKALSISNGTRIAYADLQNELETKLRKRLVDLCPIMPAPNSKRINSIDPISFINNNYSIEDIVNELESRGWKVSLTRAL